MKPDPKKVEAIKKMEAPINKQQLQSFLGVVTYLGQFVQNVSDMTYNMRKLLKKNALFQWIETHEADFQKLKGVFASHECFTYFDQKKDIFLLVDASVQGLGAALMQKDQQGRLKPVAYASKESQMLRRDIKILSMNNFQLSLAVLDSITICMLENLNVTVTINL